MFAPTTEHNTFERIEHCVMPDMSPEDINPNFNSKEYRPAVVASTPSLDSTEQLHSESVDDERGSNEAEDEDMHESKSNSSSSSGGTPTTLYTVTEVWLPIPDKEDFENDCLACGVNVVAAFHSESEALKYAQRMVTHLEILTKTPRPPNADGSSHDPGFDWWDCEEEDPFSGRWQETLPMETRGGRKQFKVCWGNRTSVVQVERIKVFSDAAKVTLPTPLHGQTCTNLTW